MLSIRLTLLVEIVMILDRVYLSTGVTRSLVRDWVRIVENRVSTRGPVDTIDWIKAIRLCCTRYLSGKPLSTTPGIGLEIGENGLPVGIPLIPSLFEARDPPKVRLGLTLLNVSRALPGWKSPNLDPITRHGKVVNKSFLVDLAATVTDLGWKLPRPIWSRCHLTTNAGPNAQALVGSVEDASLLTSKQLRCLELLSGEEIIRTIENVRLFSPLAWLKILFQCKYFKTEISLKGRLGRLSLIKDKEAKVRIVALLDYWTQSGLKPLHDACFKLLRSLRPDCTFNQGSFRSKLPRKGPYYSFDLSNATDRMPVDVQVCVLSVLISPEYAEAWKSLLVDRDYWLTWKPGHSVRYACGQPMGAYSSWAMFAITHHAIVRLAARRAGLDVTFSNYVVLGDDIVIASAAVAQQYQMILSELGVDISEQKSHVSLDTYEFAKRWIHNGLEVTGAPLGSLFDAVRIRRSEVRTRFKGQNQQHDVVDLAKLDPRNFVAYVSFTGLAAWFKEVEARWLSRSDMLVSRGLLAVAFRALLPNPGYASRLADKAWRFYLVPSRDDSRRLRKYKSELLARILLGGVLSCNQYKTSSHESVMAYLIEAKAKAVESAIKRQVKDFNTFQLELSKFLPLVPEGLDAQSLLLSLPPFAVLRSSIADLQLEFDKIRRARESAPVSEWLHLELRLFLDPWRVLSSRTSKVVAMNRVSIINTVPGLVKQMVRIRELMLSGASDKLLQQLVLAARSKPSFPKPRRVGDVKSSSKVGVRGRRGTGKPDPKIP